MHGQLPARAAKLRMPHARAPAQELFKPGSHANAREADIKRAGSGSASDATAPFISGHFEYGLGRAAGQRHVFLFIGKSQDHTTLEADTNVTFLGIYKTNRAVRARSCTWRSHDSASQRPGRRCTGALAAAPGAGQQLGLYGGAACAYGRV